MKSKDQILKEMDYAKFRFEQLKNIGEYKRNIVQTEVMHKMEAYKTALEWVLKENNNG